MQDDPIHKVYEMTFPSDQECRYTFCVTFWGDEFVLYGHGKFPMDDGVDTGRETNPNEFNAVMVKDLEDAFQGELQNKFIHRFDDEGGLHIKIVESDEEVLVMGAAEVESLRSLYAELKAEAEAKKASTEQ